MKAEESVRSFIERNGWIRDCHVTVAFSGGYDSLCLLILLKKHLTTVSALYVNHNLRPEEELARELEINRDNCARLDVPLEIVTLKRGEIERIARERGITIEAAARDARYRVFENRGIIATAHNRNDQVETVMMKLLSGGTLLSLAGVRPVRDSIVRPLLESERADIVRFVTSCGFSPSNDSTNDTLFCMRNRVRRLLVPYLKKDICDTLCRIAENVSQIEDKLENIEVTECTGYRFFSKKAFFAASPLSQLKVLYTVYSIYENSRLSEGERRQIVSAIASSGVLDARSFSLRIRGDEVRFYPAPVFFCTPFSLPCSLPFGLKLDKSDTRDALRIDTSLLKGPAIIRFSQEGDEILHCNRAVPVLPPGCPYVLVLQDREGIKAVFAAAFGAHNRISDNMRSADWESLEGVEIARC